MAVDKRFIVKKLQNAEELYVIYSGTTKLPFVKRNIEVKRNTILTFGDEEGARAAFETLKEEKYAVQIIKVENKDLLTFYADLVLMDVNAINFEEAGENTIVDLGEVVKTQQNEAGKRPLINPALKSAMMYFLQDLRKPGATEKPARELTLRGEQVNSLLAGSRFITAMIIPEDGEEKLNPKNLQLPIVKAQNGDNFQPLFTDFQEFQRYNQQKRLRPMVMTLAEAQTLLVSETKGFLLNPTTSMLPITKEMIPQILSSYMSWAVPKDTKNVELRANVRKLQNSRELYVLYSSVTHMPFVECDEEVFDDQIYVFATEEECKEAAKAYLEKKYAVMGAKVEQHQMLRFLSDLHFIGINSIVYKAGAETVRFALEDVVNEVNYDRLPEQNRPISNPNLHLTALYFLQEVRKPRTEEERKEMGIELHDQDEELSSNLFKGKYIVPTIVEKNEETQKNEIKVPFIKDKKEELYLPIFTDSREYLKFDKNRQFRQISVDFATAKKFRNDQAKGYILNPSGFMLPLQWNQIDIILQKFTPEEN